MSLQRTDEPPVLARARPELEKSLEREWATKRSRGPEPDPVLDHPDVLSALMTMTDDCCAYCERPLALAGPDAAVVTHHRPTWGAVDSDGTVELAAYWWLCYRWNNLYPACPDCVRTRGTRFPVRGPRAGRDGDPADERPMLLDPAVDEIDTHLRYEPDGTITALTGRGKATCEVLALNRDNLVKARAALITQLDAEGPDPVAPGFATVRRQRPGSFGSVGSTSTEPSPGEARLPAQPAAYDLGHTMDATQREHYFRATQWIERVVIKNFRPVRDLEVDLSRSTSERGPWTVLLGENGSGKSSILHAIALTMIGGTQRRTLGIDARTYLRHGARSGLVQVYLSGRTDPLELTWAQGDAEFTGPEPVPALLLGYGATRLLPRYAGQEADPRMARVDNLFDPLLPLTDPTSWLLSLDDERFEEVSSGLAELLALGPDDLLVRRKGDVFLAQGRALSDIGSLSDGYQSMLVMACDVLRSVLSLWDGVALAEGIVLIDELGAHLHPRWRMRIVSAIRRLMPRVQFIVSTHDPLCLRGVVDGEVIVVRRTTDGDVVSISDLPPVAGMRVDQLLTSEHFGLGTTDDPEVDELWETYYALQGLARPDREQRARLEQVRTRLDALEQFGTTERDRLLLTSAADYIARRRQTGDTVGPTSAQVTAELSELWAKHLGGGS